MKRTIAITAATLTCLLLLTGFFLLWQHGHKLNGALEYSLVITELVLFAMLGIRFMPRWFEAWSNKPSIDTTRAKSSRELLPVLLMLIGFGVLMHFTVKFVSLFTDISRDVLRAADTNHYLDIAENWYRSEGTRDELVRLVFFPLYPLLIKLFQLYPAFDSFKAALAVSFVCFIGAGLYLYLLARIDLKVSAARRVLKYFLILPGSFFYLCAMTESLFVLLCAACLYYTRKQHYLLACITAAFAAFTRAPGIILFAPVCFEMVRSVIVSEPGTRKGAALKLLMLLIIPLGLIAYMVINYTVSGSFTQFLTYEHEHWGQHLDWFFSTVRYQLSYALGWFRSGDKAGAITLWGANLISQFSALVIMIFAVKKLRPSYTAFFIAYFVITMGASWLLSAPRYLCACVTLPFALAYITKRRRADNVLTVLCAVCSLMYFIAYLKGMPVY